MNLYAYVHNNPLTHIDPDGLSALNREEAGTNQALDRLRAFGQGLRNFGSEFVQGASDGVFKNPLELQTTNYIAESAGLKAAGGEHNAGRMIGEVASNAAMYYLGGKAIQYGLKGVQAIGKVGSGLVRTMSASAKLEPMVASKGISQAGLKAAQNSLAARVSTFSAKSSTVERGVAQSVLKQNTQQIGRSPEYAKELAKKIASGHAFDKHVLFQGEFKGFIRTRAQFENHVRNVIQNPTHVRDLGNGKFGFWDSKSGTVVVETPWAKDGGTAFVPRRGMEYFTDMLE